MKYAECTLTSNENEGVTLGDAMTKSGNRNAISKDCHKKVVKKNHYGESVSFNVVLRVSGRPEKLKSISPQDPCEESVSFTLVQFRSISF